MKLFKYSILALALAAGFSSCKDDDKYEPGAASDGVYFPTDDALEVELDRSLTYFEVTVARLGETAAATYGLTGIADDEVFSIPTSVSFAEGETSTKVKIDYVQANMGLDKPYDVTLAFAEGTKLSSYGFDRLDMAVTLPAPWTTIGKGTYRDQYLLVFSSVSEEPDFNPSWECEIQQHDIDPTRFRWVHPYGENFAKYVSSIGGGELEPGQYDDQGKYYIEFVCDQKYNKVLVPFQSLGFQFFSDGVMSVCNEAGLYYPKNDYETIVTHSDLSQLCGEVTWKTVKDEETEEERTIPATVYTGKQIAIVSFSDEPEYYAGEGYQWAAEGVELTDTDIEISYEGVLVLPNETQRIIANVKLGEDIANAKVGLVATTDLDEAIEAVTNDAVASQEITESTTAMRFAFDGSADYSIAVVAYDEDGEIVASNAITFFVADNSAPSDWISLGKGTYTDLFALAAKSSTGQWTVELQQNVVDDRYYRFVHPYGDAFAQFANENELFGPGVSIPASQYDSNNELYMNFVAVGNRVAIPVQNTAVILDNNGTIAAGNRGGWNCESEEDYNDDYFDKVEQFYATQYPNDNLNCFNVPTFSNGKLVKLTQPAKCTTINFPDTAPDKFYSLTNDEGGVNWVADGASAAPAKAPNAGSISLKRAMMSVAKRAEIARDYRKAIRLRKAAVSIKAL